MSKYMCCGDKIKCSMGDKGVLNVLPLNMTFCDNKPVGNIMDNKPFVNIPPLGMCKSLANPIVAAATAANKGKLQKMPCIPNTTMPWMLAKMNTLVGGKPALLDSSKLMCMWCGVITFEKENSSSSKAKEENKESKDKIIIVDKFLLYETKKTKYGSIENGKEILAEDLTSNDKTKEELLAISSIKKNFKNNLSKLDDSEFLFASFKGLIKNLSIGKLEKVGLEMVDTFKNNTSSYTTEFQHADLKNAVIKHQSTKNFIKEAKTALENCIYRNLDEIKTKNDKEIKKILTKNKEVMEDINKTYLPLFNDWSNRKRIFFNGDIIRGLTILIDSIWSLQVYVKNLRIKDNKILSYELNFEIYDHFGLDYEDIEKVGNDHNGFNSWYILQHYDKYKYKPFITKICFDVKKDGEI